MSLAINNNFLSLNAQRKLGIVDTITGGGFSYEGGYVASRYLHGRLKAMGVDGGMKGLMTYRHAHQAANLDTALNAVTGGQYQDTADFMADFAANGASFIGNMNLTNADTGAIGGLDVDGGPTRDARGVVPPSGSGTPAQPLRNFKVAYPDIGAGDAPKRRVQIQVGAGAGDLVDMEFGAMNASALGVADLDLHKPSVALMRIDDALASVTAQPHRGRRLCRGRGPADARPDPAAGGIGHAEPGQWGASGRARTVALNRHCRFCHAVFGRYDLPPTPTL
ncbi:hypothetical protein [Telluria antibiotica]|uniref:hypothetical protein n=1 Tax=Telluria antibiotica TaxID=2717319 RepID=UPI003FCC3222